MKRSIKGQRSNPDQKLLLMNNEHEIIHRMDIPARGVCLLGLPEMPGVRYLNPIATQSSLVIIRKEPKKWDFPIVILGLVRETRPKTSSQYTALAVRDPDPDKAANLKALRRRVLLFIIISNPISLSSSVGQSNCLLSSRSGVRVSSGAPKRTVSIWNDLGLELNEV